MKDVLSEVCGSVCVREITFVWGSGENKSNWNESY